MKNTFGLATVVTSLGALTLAACTIITAPRAQTPPPATTAAPAATPAPTQPAATTQPAGPGRIITLPGRNPGTVPPATTVKPMTGSNMFGAQAGSPTALKGMVYWIPADTKTMPDLDKLSPVTSLYSEVLNAPARDFKEGFPGVDANKVEFFAIRYTGQFVVAAAGDYAFRIVAKDGAKVFVDNSLAVDNDGLHGPQSKTATVKLTAGTHALRVDYFQGPKFQAALQLFVTGPDGKEKPWMPAF